MNEEEIKKYLRDNLRIHVDFEDRHYNSPTAKRLVVTLRLGREVINESKLWLQL